MVAAVSLRGVRHRRAAREVLHVEGLDIAPGERVSVLGPNGAGKTTLLRLLAAVETPTSGRVTLDGVGTDGAGAELRRRVAYATQRPGLLSTSVLRNVELPLRWRRVPRAHRREIALSALDRLRVAHLAHRPAPTLSGGEQQRVSLARALALDPDVLLLDEPAAALDAQTRTEFFADLDRVLADRAATVVQVSHRAAEALRLADRVVVLADGRVHQVGSPEDLNRHPTDASVAALVGYDNLVDAVAHVDGSVRVHGQPTGVRAPGRVGPVTLAVFAAGVHLTEGPGPGFAARVARVAPGPGHRVVTLEGGAHGLVAHLPLRGTTPEVGRTVRVRFDAGLSAVVPARAASGAPATAAASVVPAVSGPVVR